MADNNGTSKSELESEELSLETSVPTDLTLSPESDEGKDYRKRTLKQQLERKQLIHDVQLLKIELSHKSLVIENMKAEYMSKLDDLEEKLADAQHQKQVLQTRLESQLQIQQEEAKRRIKATNLEMEVILKKQQELEIVNSKLQEKAVNILKTLQDLDLTEDDYIALKQQHIDQLSLRDYVAVRLYDIVWPLRKENNELKLSQKRLKDEVKTIREEIIQVKEDFEIEHHNYKKINEKYQRLNAEYSELQSQLKDFDFKHINYDKIKSERDRFEEEFTSLKNSWSNIDATNKFVTKERDDLKSEVGSMKQKLLLLQKDKDYLSKHILELNSKLKYAEEKLFQSNNFLEKTKEAREEMYEKYISARDQYKNEYEQRLKDEIESIRQKTNEELEKLRISQTQLQEFEIKSLKDEKDVLLKQKDKLEISVREITKQYDEIRMQIKHLQTKDDSKISELRSELQLKNLELDRTRMVEAEVTRNFKELQIESERLHKKLEVLTTEVYEQQNKYQVKVTELETLMAEKSARLETYEKLENDLDEIVMHAAEVGDDQETERVLFSYGYGANVPTTAKRRLQQSVQLARRVLAVEKLNTSLVMDLEKEKNKVQILKEELHNANDLLTQVQQPYNYIIESIQIRDAQIKQQREKIAILEKDLSSLKKERDNLMKVKVQLTQDLERLLNQREELRMMKRILLKLQSGGETTYSDEATDVPVSDSPDKFPEATIFFEKMAIQKSSS